MLEGPISRKGWTRVRFDQIATQINDRVANPAGAGVERYVGLEHLDPDSLCIRRWGEPTDVESTKLRFGPGDIIFGKRRVYQRKLAVADFEGICSAHAMVLRAKRSAVLPEFLPYFMQSDLFMRRALSISVGSLSPTINWKALAAEEFLLPSLEEQGRLAEVLSASQALVEALTRHALAARTAFLAAVDDVFTRSAQRGDHAVAPLSDLATKIVDGVHHTPSYTKNGVPFLTVENLTRGRGIDFSETRFISEEDHSQFVRRANPQKGDVLITKDGTLGVSRVVETDIPFSIFVSVALVSPVRKVLDPWFLRFYFESTLFKNHIGSRISGSALKHIHLVDLRESPIPVMSLARQMEASRSLSHIHAAIDAIDLRIAAARKTCGRILEDAEDCAN